MSLPYESTLENLLMPLRTLALTTAIACWFLAGPVNAALTLDYLSSYDSYGVPTNLDPIREVFSQQFLADLANSLPESRSVTLHHPEYITSDAGANIHLNELAEVFVTFLHEGAGYQNALGYFTFDANNPPSSAASLARHIVFPNASFPGSGGNLASGSTVKLGVFPADTYIGFFVVSNGWTGTQVQERLWTVYSLANLNPEPDSNLRRHVAMLWDPGTQRAILAFEDMRRDKGSDDDFNDVMFTIRTTPVRALDTTTLKPVDPVQDADGDGATDGIDQFPADPLRAFETWYPSETTWGSIAFEDSWPKVGDFDFNDLVLNYQARQITNANGLVKDIVMDFRVVARGAAMHDGFAVRFRGVARANVSALTLQANNGTAQALVPEAGQSNAVAILFTDSHEQIGTPGKFANAFAGSPLETGSRFTLSLTLNTPISASLLGPPPYDAFMIIDQQRGREVHQVIYGPTNLGDRLLLGTQDDTSNRLVGPYYRTEGNLPWVLVLPIDFQWPIEKTDIALAYPQIIGWGLSGGSTSTDWYRTGIVAKEVWQSNR